MQELPLITAVANDDATAAFDHLRASDETCSWCFGHIRTFYPEYDEAVGNHLGGRKLGNAPAMQVITASSDASPTAYQDVVPPRTDKYGHVLEPARPRTVCECGVIDFDSTDNRGKGDLLLAVRNIAGHHHDAYLPFDTDAAETVVDKAADRRFIGTGRDMEILEHATRLGLDIGERRARKARLAADS